MEKAEPYHGTDFGPESKEELFNKYIEKGKAAALDLVKQRFEDDPNEENRLDYHTRPHTRDVIRRVGALLRVVVAELKKMPIPKPPKSWIA